MERSLLCPTCPFPKTIQPRRRSDPAHPCFTFSISPCTLGISSNAQVLQGWPCWFNEGVKRSQAGDYAAAGTLGSLITPAGDEWRWAEVVGVMIGWTMQLPG